MTPLKWIKSVTSKKGQLQFQRDIGHFGSLKCQFQVRSPAQRASGRTRPHCIWKHWGLIPFLAFSKGSTWTLHLQSLLSLILRLKVVWNPPPQGLCWVSFPAVGSPRYLFLWLQCLLWASLLPCPYHPQRFRCELQTIKQGWYPCNHDNPWSPGLE
jgi:hypothetical protein